MANTYIIDDTKLVIVDPGSELSVQLTLSYLQQFLKRSATDIDLIVLTHLHPDHTNGVETLRRFCQAPVAASLIAQNLAQQEAQGQQLIPGIAHFADQVISNRYVPGVLPHLDLFPPHYASQVKLIDIWLEDVAGLPHHLDWRVIASPGHTPESLCLYNPFSNELICGDTVITIEGEGPHIRGATNRRLLEETLRTLRSLEVRYLYPGHGRPIIARRPLSSIFTEW